MSTEEVTDYVTPFTTLHDVVLVEQLSSVEHGQIGAIDGLWGMRIWAGGVRVRHVRSSTTAP